MFAEQIIDFRRAVRLKIQELFTVGSPLENASQLLKRVLYESEEVQMHLPVQVGDYTDFCEWWKATVDVKQLTEDRDITRCKSISHRERWAVDESARAAPPTCLEPSSHWLSRKSVFHRSIRDPCHPSQKCPASECRL